MHAENFRPKANAVTEAIDDHEDHPAIKWTLEYCTNEPTNIQSGGDSTLVGL
jgi:hypothetical protein